MDQVLILNYAKTNLFPNNYDYIYFWFVLFERHIGAKWPFFWLIWLKQSLKGHLSDLWLFIPQILHLSFVSSDRSCCPSLLSLGKNFSDNLASCNEYPVTFSHPNPYQNCGTWWHVQSLWQLQFQVLTWMWHFFSLQTIDLAQYLCRSE